MEICMFYSCTNIHNWLLDRFGVCVFLLKFHSKSKAGGKLGKVHDMARERKAHSNSSNMDIGWNGLVQS